MGKSIKTKNNKSNESHSPKRYIDKKSCHSKMRNKQRELDRAVRNNDWDAIEELEEDEDYDNY